MFIHLPKSKGFLIERIASSLNKILVSHNVGQGNDFSATEIAILTCTILCLNPFEKKSECLHDIKRFHHKSLTHSIDVVFRDFTGFFIPKKVK